MGKRIDISGKQYGHLKVRGLTDKVKGTRARKWIVDCAACGGSTELKGNVLRAGQVTSCGCRSRLNLSGFNLVARMKKSGQRLCKSQQSTEASSPDTRFFLEPSGKTIRRDAAESAIAAQELVGTGDGLFNDTPQTWVAR